MKNVLIVSQVIPQWYIDTLTAALDENTHIDIITGSDDVVGNLIPSPKHDPRSFKSRLICWIKHYRFMSTWIKENKDKHYDMIFAVSNPPINSAIGLKLKKVFKAPFVYMNWDIYPQVIESTIHNPVVQLVCGCWNKWNSKNYKKIDKILTIGPVVAKSMNAGLKNSVDIAVLPIAVDTERLKPIDNSKNKFSVKYGLANKFIVLYSGKMGMGHNIELILKSAKLLEKYEDICFLFFGNGPKYELVENFIKKNDSKNVKLFPLQSEEMFPYSMACGDVGIVSQEASMAHLFMPSKTYSMMACGQAIVGIGTDHDDLYDLINKNEIGETVVNESEIELADKILGLYKEKEKLDRYQKKARKVAEKHFDINIVTEQYKNIFRKLM